MHLCVWKWKLSDLQKLLVFGKLNVRLITMLLLPLATCDSGGRLTGAWTAAGVSVHVSTSELTSGWKENKSFASFFFSELQGFHWEWCSNIQKLNLAWPKKKVKWWERDCLTSRSCYHQILQITSSLSAGFFFSPLCSDHIQSLYFQHQLSRITVNSHEKLTQ